MLARLALAACLLASPAMAAQVITGRASVVDGDTIEIAGKRIRLYGIDAPESWQVCRDGKGKPYRCGAEAAAALADFLAASRPTACSAETRDRYGRVVAICRRADGANVSTWMVRQGWAVDFRKYSRGAFAGAEIDARAEGLGLWRGDFDEPCRARALMDGGASRC